MNVNEIDLNDVSCINSFISQKKIHDNHLLWILNFNLFIKRIMDIIFSLFGILLLIPLSICIAVANFFAGDKGPLFYSSKRIGKNGKYFNIYKFRSMCIDADKKLNDILESDENIKNEWIKNQKIQNDPRVTKVGNFIRKTSLDEFPQFINVLIGNMSLIGPRPVVDGEIEKFGLLKDTVLSMKPGITGNWAANGRSSTTYNERVFMEAMYVQNFSIWFDIKILFKTIPSVFNKIGAL